MSEIQYCMR